MLTNAIAILLVLLALGQVVRSAIALVVELVGEPVAAWWRGRRFWRGVLAERDRGRS